MNNNDHYAQAMANFNAKVLSDHRQSCRNRLIKATSNTPADSLEELDYMYRRICRGCGHEMPAVGKCGICEEDANEQVDNEINEHHENSND